MNIRPSFFLLLLPLLCAADDGDYREILVSDRPVAYWRFDIIQDCCTPNETHGSLRANAGDKVSLLEAGPRPPLFPAFVAENTAADFTCYPRDTYLRVKDPGPRSEFDFTNGDTITLEAWVQCRELAEGQNVYVVGKGRTGSPGFAPDNQNWALRLRGQGGIACVSFIFRDTAGSGDSAWHRWTTSRGFTPGDGWHHVAVSYTFGQPDSVHAYLNGELLDGIWDLGGATTKAPVEDDDEVWIGGAMGGAAHAQFTGRIDELAIYRIALPRDRIQAHADRDDAMPELKDVPSGTIVGKNEALPLPPAIVRAEELPPGKVRIQIFEHSEAHAPGVSPNVDPSANAHDAAEEPWTVLPSEKTDEFIEPFFALSGIPDKYDERGAVVKRSSPFLIRAAGIIRFPAGEHALHLRAPAGARIAVDGQIVADCSLQPLRYHAGQPPLNPPKTPPARSLPILRLGHKEDWGRFSSDGQPHVLLIECLVGTNPTAADIGELFVAVAKESSPFSLVPPTGTGAVSPVLTPSSWAEFVRGQRARIHALNLQRRGVR